MNIVKETHTITIITIQTITTTFITIQSNICYSDYLSKLKLNYDYQSKKCNYHYPTKYNFESISKLLPLLRR